MTNNFIEKNVYIDNLKEFKKKKDRIIKDGINDLIVLSDFDRTLTYGFIDNKKIPPMIGILRDSGKYLDNDYVNKARNLAEKYRAFEISFKIKSNEKEKLMMEWWSKHLELLVDKKLNKKHFIEIINSNKIKFRDGLTEIFEFLYKNKVPLIIISASGLGDEPISMLFRKEDKLYSNIFIISNSFIWDKDGYAKGYKKNIIHPLNKDKVSIKNYLSDEIINKKNIILLGDTVDDIKMASNFNYKNIIKICFLNQETSNNINDYKKFYDVLILNDSSIDFLNNFLLNFNINH